jgi:hypothetical protein
MESISEKNKDQHCILVNGNRVSVSFSDQSIDHKQKRFLDKHERYLQRVKNHILNEFSSFNFTRKSHQDQDYYNSLDNNNNKNTNQNRKRKNFSCNSQSNKKFSLDYGLEEEEKEKDKKNVQLDAKYATTANSTTKSNKIFTASTPLAPFKEITNYVISKAIGTRNKTSFKHKCEKLSLNENYLKEYLINIKQESKKSKKSKKMSSSHVFTKNSTGSMVTKLQNSILKRQQAKINLTLKSNEAKSSSPSCASCTYCDQCQMSASSMFVPNSWLENSNILSSTHIAQDDEMARPFNLKTDFITTRNKIKPHTMGMVKNYKLGKVKGKKSYMLPRTSSLNGNTQMHGSKAFKVSASKTKEKRRSEKFLKKLQLIDSFQHPQQNSTASSSNENFNNFGDLLVWYV